jgi:hypothetical protein
MAAKAILTCRCARFWSGSLLGSWGHRDAGRTHLRLFTARALTELADFHGLALEHLEAVGYYPLPPAVARLAESAAEHRLVLDAIDAGDGPVHPSLREVLAGNYQPLARPLEVDEVCGPHLVLADTGDVDRVVAPGVVDGPDCRLRLERPAR